MLQTASASRRHDRHERTHAKRMRARAHHGDRPARERGANLLRKFAMFNLYTVGI